ncbi:hypothetical protein V5F89_10305 [Pelagerythrobacter marensis]|uniref:Uncharacterized protein n=1 Tax=Pelagerythrobacter marensis TaxID=543877 RepID=A0ABZ2D781_9SPHN
MSEESAAAEAVRQVLLGAGFSERPDADLIVETGFSVRPKELAIEAVGEDGETKAISPPAGGIAMFCTPKAYVLNIAFVDALSGEVNARSGAIVRRCRADEDIVLRDLAETALTASG